MKVAFLSEMGFNGKILKDYPNMRTEFAWMCALNADHRNIYQFHSIEGYDHVFIVFPKGEVFLNAVGVKLMNKHNPISELLKNNIVAQLKTKNKRVHYVQEGPHWLWNDYEMLDQVNFYNLLMQCDSVFAHNEFDAKYYRGLLPSKRVEVIRTLMIETLLLDMQPKTEDKVVIGGNFARWYGGFESYIVAAQFELPIYAQTSHAKRDGEELMDGLTHLPRFYWKDWMNALKDFKYAVHLMPTVAAGTFSLNCAYFGIPCIGNEKVDTQKICHPELSVDVADVEKAIDLVVKLRSDEQFYKKCSESAKQNYKNNYSESIWKSKMELSLQNI